MLGGNDALRFPLASLDQCPHALLFLRGASGPISIHFIIILHFFKDLIKKQDRMQNFGPPAGNPLNPVDRMLMLSVFDTEDDTMNAFEDSTTEQTQGAVKGRTAEPPMFRVVLHNDAFTPRIIKPWLPPDV